jgi:hypothetical protein
VLFLAGASYSLWAVARLQDTPVVLETEAFDRPVAHLAGIAAARLARLARTETKTPLELTLLAEAHRNGDVAARATLCLLRLLFAFTSITIGFGLLAWTIGRAPLLSILARASRFESNEEFFHTVDVLLARLEASGHQQAVAKLRDGLSGFNGLTDGSALFLQSIERVQVTEAQRFDRDDQRALERIRAAVHRAVYRR